MPDLISDQGLSLTRLWAIIGSEEKRYLGYQSVFESVLYFYLYYLEQFETLLEVENILNLAFALVGKMRGGPLKLQF